MNNNTGGPAFPRSESLYPDGAVSDPGAQGLSIRDYFAAKAMQGLMGRVWSDMPAGDLMDVWATSAYAAADAMLKAREVKP